MGRGEPDGYHRASDGRDRQAAGPLDRLADAAEDATAHVAHASRFFRKPLTVAVIVMLVGIGGFSVYFVEMWPHHYSYQAGAYSTDNSHISLGGVRYTLDRKQFEARLAGAKPEAIRKYYVEIGGRRFPVKQAVSVASARRGRVSAPTPPSMR